MTVLDQILELTAAVENCVDEGDWLAADELNQRRQQLLRGLLQDRDAAQLDDATRQALREVLARNEASVVKLTAQRGELTGTRQRIKRGVAAVTMYQQASEARHGE
jgi:hypothetical protein